MSPHNWEVEAGGFRVQDHPWWQSERKVSLRKLNKMGQENGQCGKVSDIQTQGHGFGCLAPCRSRCVDGICHLTLGRWRKKIPGIHQPTILSKSMSLWSSGRNPCQKLRQRAGKKPQGVKTFATKPEDLSLTPGIHMMEGENGFPLVIF